ncbi:hypothetical protein GA0111570_10974 [Raineyella antarctica]|uniref:Uncharacterized protein n=1 Tax=Raineyella antarctica TaxID=1577474 RepID=A0A1G6HH90_9ACTN|nr:CueP family metal-binding protein [Raineyella antarctica]SDB92806.1 hypothetical protein GA0111570_10974 [Raineyella antarctica]
MKKLLPALVVIGALTLAGCSAADQAAAPAPSVTSATTSAPDTSDAAVQGVLATAALQGKDTAQVIAALETSTDDKQSGPAGSVRYDQLVLSTADAKVAMPIPADKFYLSVAPYVNRTHDCYYHSLATCQGELANTTVHVTITDAAGATLVDEDTTLHANGFAGFWLPRDIQGTLTVTYDGKQATTPIATGKDDPTCLTTLKLA